jgi:benzoyl-CoA reductase/2-hydroxyglutaryl-CoA dehydratase subunit BcrC/BadD/HgdB
MGAMDRLSEHMDGRYREIRKKREGGVKIIGYTPGGYMPEELVYASGAIPVCLLRGGDHEAVAESAAYIPRFIDTFCRSQIGYRMLEEEPLYQMVDLLVVPITDNNMRAIAECWNFYTDVEVFRYGVPHNKEEDAYDYYLEGLNLLREKLGSFTGNKIDDGKLKDAIELWNRMRTLFKEISLLRKSDKLPLSGQEFVRLSHASFIADMPVFVEILESLVQELKKKEGKELSGARLLMTGSTLAMGDYKMFDLVEGAGSDIVIEEFAEGVREYWDNVELDGGSISKALADSYFMKRLSPAWNRPSGERIDYIINLAKEFRADGVLWYQTMYRDGYDIQSFYFEKKIKERANLSMLKIETDYDVSEKGPFRTRIEAFVEMLNKRKGRKL